MARLPTWLLLLALAPLTGTAACDNTNLPDAFVTNVVDTVTIGALVGTPIGVPSGYSVFARGPVRTDTTSSFDFAYNIEPSGRRVFLPLAVLGLSTGGADPGLRSSSLAFDAITEAPSNGYTTQDTVPFAVGDRFVVRGQVLCSFLGVPQYGKIEVLSVDDQARVVTFRTLTNNNCGYKGLQPGLPEE